MIKKILSILRRALLTRQRFYSVEGKVQQQPIDSLVNQWLICRSKCIYRIDNFASLPLENRNIALKNEVLQWSPFKETGFYVFWKNSWAMVWLWDAAAVNLPIELGSSEDIDILPETVLDKSYTDGYVLRVCLSGYEGQLWASGVLKDSVWWAVAPTIKEWKQLAASQGQSLTDDFLPISDGALTSTSLQNSPWGQNYWSRLFTSHMVEKIVPSVSLISLVAGLGFFCAIAFSSWIALRLAESAFEKEQIFVGNIIEQRNEAVRLHEQNLLLQALAERPSQLQLVKEISELLPEVVQSVSQWQYQTGQLKLTLALGAEQEADPRELVSAIEASRRFTNVRVNLNTRRKDFWDITLEVVQ